VNSLFQTILHGLPDRSDLRHRTVEDFVK